MKWVRGCLVLALFCAPATAQDRPASRGADDAPAMNEQERRFSERMSNVALTGYFTVVGQNTSNLKEERYEIESVKKLRDDYWVWIVRIKYGKTDVKLPLTLKVLWAGDTPMVSLTDFEIPLVGGGKFGARVLFHEDRYAGTWQHDEVGGHLFGTIEKMDEADARENGKTPRQAK